jgi:hypothetical protein
LRVYYKNSLFSYLPSENGYNYDAYRVTVFTFGKPASKRTLKKMLKEFVGDEVNFPNWEPSKTKVAWEKRQVEPTASRGIGFNFADISVLKYKGRELMQPEKTLAVWQLQAYEKVDLRLGRSDFNQQISHYRAYKNLRKRLVVHAKSFWEWLTH